MKGAATTQDVVSLRKMLVVANTDWFIANFMSSFLQAHIRGGIDVVAASPTGSHSAELRKAGIRWIELPMSRGRGSVRSNLATMATIRRLQRKLGSDLIHFVTAKPVVLGNLALSVKAAPRIVNVLPGLGHAFSTRGASAWIYRQVLLWGVRRAAAQPGALTVFHQQADQERMLGSGGRAISRLIPGWGVDLTRFSQVAQTQDPPLVVMVSRMLWSKGVGDYVEAAQICRAVTSARFVLVGDPDMGNPAPVPTGQLEVWHQAGAIEWWRHRDDIPEILARASVLVLPSRYGEGVPQALIEAAAMGVPIVASDLAGCREVVEDGKNGWLVPPGDVGGMADAVLSLLRDSGLRQQMGAQGRELARQRFAVDQILGQYGEAYRTLGLEWPGGPGESAKADLRHG